jgi:hypothetical protein
LISTTRKILSFENKNKNMSLPTPPTQPSLWLPQITQEITARNHVSYGCRYLLFMLCHLHHKE